MEALELVTKDDLEEGELEIFSENVIAEHNNRAIIDAIIMARHAWQQQKKRVQDKFGASSEQLKLPNFEQIMAELAAQDAQSSAGENGEAGTSYETARQKAIAELREEEEKIHIEYDRRPRTSKREVVKNLSEVENHFYPDSKEFEALKDQCQELAPETHEEIIFKPAVMYNEKTVLHVFAYTDENGETTIFKAKSPKSKLIPGSYVSPTLGAHVLTSKVLLDQPLYRQAKNFLQIGMNISRQTLSNWCIQLTEQYLNPLCQRIISDFGKMKVTQIDETPVRVLHTTPPDGKETGNKYGNIIAGTSGPFEQTQMKVYSFANSKAAETFEAVLPADYDGTIVCDAAPVHNHFKKATLSFCMTHARRKFVEIVKSRTDYKRFEKLKSAEEQDEFIDQQKSPGLRKLLHVLVLFSNLYYVEKVSRKKHETPAQILKRRQEYSVPFFEELAEQIRQIKKGFSPQSSEVDAAEYFLSHEDGLRAYLNDGNLPVDNNASERTVKAFVMARKNFLFSNSERGAAATADAFTIVESAVANGLRPEAYLAYILETLRTEGLRDDVIERLLPYSGKLPADLYLPGWQPKQNSSSETDSSAQTGEDEQVGTPGTTPETKS